MKPYVLVIRRQESKSDFCNLVSLSSAGRGGAPLDEVNFTRIMLKLKYLWSLFKENLYIILDMRLTFMIPFIEIMWTVKAFWYLSNDFREQWKLILVWKRLKQKLFVNSLKILPNSWKILCLETSSQWTTSIRATLSKLEVCYIYLCLIYIWFKNWYNFFPSNFHLRFRVE